MIAGGNPVRLASFAAAAAMVIGLGGCGGEPPASKERSAALDERLGPAFIEISRADAKAKPKEISPGDLPPVSLTEQPIDF